MHLHKAYYGLALAVGTTALAVLVGNQTFWIAALMGSGVLALLGFQSERRANDAEALQRSPAPSIVFYPPRTDEHVPMAHGGTQPFAFGAVENRKPAPGSGVIGQKARLSLDFYEAET